MPRPPDYFPKQTSCPTMFPAVSVFPVPRGFALPAVLQHRGSYHTTATCIRTTFRVNDMLQDYTLSLCRLSELTACLRITQSGKFEIAFRSSLKPRVNAKTTRAHIFQQSIAPIGRSSSQATFTCGRFWVSYVSAECLRQLFRPLPDFARNKLSFFCPSKPFAPATDVVQLLDCFLRESEDRRCVASHNLAHRAKRLNTGIATSFCSVLNDCVSSICANANN